MQSIHDYDGEESPRRRETTRDALLFTLLTWARTNETRFTAWHEFENLEGTEPLWRLSAERMKMTREHLVPLSRQVVALLLRRRRASNDDFVFPGAKVGRPISENTMIYACYRMGYLGKQTVHGFRGLGSTWANEAELYKPDWVEMALAHEDEDEVRGAYNSALYLTPRRRMLQAWADYLENGDCDAVANAPPARPDRGTPPIGTPATLSGRPIFWQKPRLVVGRRHVS